MTRLFSYVVDHDLGYAPDPFGGYCSLVQCKFSKTGKRKNIVELAEVSDWILGTGGKGPNTAGVRLRGQGQAEGSGLHITQIHKITIRMSNV